MERERKVKILGVSRERKKRWDHAIGKSRFGSIRVESGSWKESELVKFHGSLLSYIYFVHPIGERERETLLAAS
jgi:hypothetical protein